MFVVCRGETDCVNHHIRMLVLLWATLLFSVIESNFSDTSQASGTIEENDILNLICSFQNHQPSEVTVTKSHFTENNKSESRNKPTSTLIISDGTTDLSRYTCTVKSSSTTPPAHVNVTVTFPPKSLKISGCELQSKKVSLTQTNQNTSPPTTSTKESITSTSSVSERAQVNSTPNTTQSGGDCKSCEQDLLQTLLSLASKQQNVIIAFFTGSLLTAIICCLTTKCCRKKQKSSGNMVETLDMVTTEAVQLMDDGQSVENEIKAAEGGAEAAGQSMPDAEPKEVEYSDIDFSRWKRTSSAEEIPKTSESEYAELKKEEGVEEQDSGGEHGEEELGMMGDEEETKQGTLGEEEGEAVGVYDNVDEMMDQI